MNKKTLIKLIHITKFYLKYSLLSKQFLKSSALIKEIWYAFLRSHLDEYFTVGEVEFKGTVH